jgi:adenosylmethionine-8-amino-7-oxononanoate aminotransferase
MATYPTHSPVVADSARGRYIIGVEGRYYLDAFSSLWVSTLGHRVPALDAALVAQSRRLAHSTMLGNSATEVIALADELSRVVPVADPHFLFASDGASAVEQAIRMSYQYWRNLGNDQRHRFLALRHAYHGDTLGALALGDRGFGTRLFDRMLFDVLRAPGYGDSDWPEGAIEMIEQNGDSLAGVFLEPLVQAAGGIRVADPSELAAVAEAARRVGTLLVCDEVATGFGRTGRLFACDWAGISPDIVCLGKGITGGYLPMSATVASRSVYDAFLGDETSLAQLSHGHSYGGNSLAAAVARAHLKLVADDGLLAQVRERGRYLLELARRELSALAAVKDVRGIGLMVGVELDAERSVARAVCDRAVMEGVLLRPLESVIPVVAPLTTTQDELDRIVAVLSAEISRLGSAAR